jgi:cyclophilin family peptidyl-prolyl cis-trans isomerase
MKYLTLFFGLFLMAQVHGKNLPIVNIHTNLGTIVLELNPKKAPKTVANFLRYAVEGFYNGTIFHRVIAGYVIQGGGYTQDYEKKKPTYDPIPSESNNGLKNEFGTIAMARNPYHPDSATTQFFINLRDNESLDAQDLPGEGYTVFGRVIESLDVVNKIQKISTGSKGDLKNYVPQQQVFIKKITIDHLPESLNVPKHLSPKLAEKQVAEMDTFGLTLTKTKEKVEETEIDFENQSTEIAINKKAITEKQNEKLKMESENALTHEFQKNDLETMENAETKDKKNTEISLSHHEFSKDENEKNEGKDKIQPSIVTVTEKNGEEQTSQTTVDSPPNTLMVEQTPPSQMTPLTKAETRTPAYVDSPAQLTLVIKKKSNQIPKISQKMHHSTRQRFLFPPDPPSQPGEPALLPN